MRQGRAARVKQRGPARHKRAFQAPQPLHARGHCGRGHRHGYGGARLLAQGVEQAAVFGVFVLGEEGFQRSRRHLRIASGMPRVGVVGHFSVGPNSLCGLRANIPVDRAMGNAVHQPKCLRKQDAQGAPRAHQRGGPPLG